MMEDMGYKAEESYVQQTMSLFGEHDDNGDNAIDLDEFAGLWEHLGGALPAGAQVQESEAPEAQRTESPARDSELRLTFERYDSDQDGVLNNDEVRAMMESLGYKTSTEYIDGVMETFATIRDDGSTAVEFEVFEELWNHLGGGEFTQPLFAM